MSGLLRRISRVYSKKPIAESAPSPVESKAPPPKPDEKESKKEPYQPKLSELLALLQHETQQVIEYLAQPQLHQVLKQAPSASFVKIERMQVEIPIRLLVELVGKDITKQKMVTGTILEKPFLLRDGTSLLMNVLVVGPQTAETTKAESKLRLEFSVAAK